MHSLVLAALALLSLPNAVFACTVTQVDAYEGRNQNCGDAGTFTTPNVINSFTTRDLTTCAGRCLRNPSCLTFSFTTDRRCTLYGSYREDMGFKNNPKALQVYDRACFSRDCETITACNATLRCQDEKHNYAGYLDFFYHRYACGYGVNARNGRFPTRSVSYAGELEPCTAMQRCADNLGRQGGNDDDPKFGDLRSGSANLQFHRPSGRWICEQFNDEKDPGYRYYYNFVDAPNTGRNRFTVKNETIGASYGIYLNAYYYECGDCS